MANKEFGKEERATVTFGDVTGDLLGFLEEELNEEDLDRAKVLTWRAVRSAYKLAKIEEQEEDNG